MANYQEWIVKGLAVVGGGFLGALLVGLILRVASKRLSSRTVPPRVKLAARALGGIAAGWLVWMIITAPGGSGLWGGGGSLFGGRGAGEGSGKDNPSQPTHQTEPGPTSPGEPGQPETIKVILLGGHQVVDEKFYRFEDGREAYQLKDLQKILKDKEKQGSALTLVILIYEDSVAQGHSAVKNLESWAEQNHFHPRVSKPSGKAPRGGE